MIVNYLNKKVLVNALKKSHVETFAYFDLPKGELEKSYAPGKWTVQQLLHHLADAETVLYDRIRRAISKPKQVVWGFDQDAWAVGLEYATEVRPLSLNKNIYGSVREAVIHLTEAYYEKKGNNPYVHNETGLRILKEEFDKVAWHNEHHLKQIRIALANS